MQTFFLLSTFVCVFKLKPCIKPLFTELGLLLLNFIFHSKNKDFNLNCFKIVLHVVVVKLEYFVFISAANI